MSFRVHVVCEDHTLDQYVAVPVVKALMKACGRPHAKVSAVTNPRLTGISEVEKHFADVATRYSVIGDLVVFVLDLDLLDGQQGRGDRIAGFAARHAALPAGVASKVVTILARQETEVWAIWGSRSELGNTPWADVRNERDSKEVYFYELITANDRQQPGEGRRRLTESSLAGGWAPLSSACPELKDAENEVRSLLGT